MPTIHMFGAVTYPELNKYAENPASIDYFEEVLPRLIPARRKDGTFADYCAIWTDGVYGDSRSLHQGWSRWFDAAKQAWGTTGMCFVTYRRAESIKPSDLESKMRDAYYFQSSVNGISSAVVITYRMWQELVSRGREEFNKPDMSTSDDHGRVSYLFLVFDADKTHG